MIDIYKAWLGGGVNRWHIHDSPALRNSGDTNWAHSGRVAQLVHLFGGTSEEILIALFHDAPEKETGDKKAGSKTAADYEREAEVSREMGLDFQKTPLVHMCDKLDAYLWARMHGSGRSIPWMGSLERLMVMARDLGKSAELASILDNIMDPQRD